MTELIVALDTPEANHLIPILHDSGVNFFKLNAKSLMQRDFGCILQSLKNRNCDWFLDLKVYDTRDTVYQIVKEAFNLGARFITVHATLSMLESAMKTKINDKQKIIAVRKLTDGSGESFSLNPSWLNFCDGIICNVNDVHDWKQVTTKLSICPGIRYVSDDIKDYHNHTSPRTPAQAKFYGADYIVVGRPIIHAEDPAQVAISILNEIKG